MTGRAQGWKVLIVDDEADNVEMTKILLEFHGAEVRIAENGLEGMTIAAEFVPTLILLDLSMPEMDGWEMFKAIREKPELKDVRVIALTAHAMPKDSERALQFGFDDYITKPFLFDDFMEHIEKCVLKGGSSLSPEKVNTR